MLNSKFILQNVLILIALIIFMQFTFPFFSTRELPHWAFHFLFIYLFSSSLTGAYIIEKNMLEKPKTFVNVFMAISSIRMILAVLIVVILILKTGINAKYLAIFFGLGYMSFLVAEVKYLFKKSKAK